MTAVQKIRREIDALPAPKRRQLLRALARDGTNADRPASGDRKRKPRKRKIDREAAMEGLLKLIGSGRSDYSDVSSNVRKHLAQIRLDKMIR